ncbi:Protease 4, partial [termite gut metagenome]
LVDTLIYKNDVHDYLKNYMQIGEDDHLAVLGLKETMNIKKNIPKDKSGNIVAVYYAFGTIDDSGISFGEESISSEKVIKDLRKLKKDEDVKAVVLRINSLGGSAYGSEQIWYAINELKKEKPVVVSMGDYAASGGYYISCPADCIVAEPTTLTGSIGIFGMIPNAEKLANKVGVKFDVVKTNKYSDFGSLNRPLNTGEQALVQMAINHGYDIFLTRCAEGRNMSKEDIDNIAQGRVWTGAKAKELGLVDELGGI